MQAERLGMQPTGLRWAVPRPGQVRTRRWCRAQPALLARPVAMAGATTCQGPWPVLHAWAMPTTWCPAAYEQFAQRACHRTHPYCALRLAGANHGPGGG